MEMRKLAAIPATIALGLYVAQAVYAGEGKNGEETVVSQGDMGSGDGNGGGHDKNGGDGNGNGGGHDKNGGDGNGGGHDKNGGDGDGNDGGHDKNGGDGNGGGHNKNGGDGDGNGGGHDKNGGDGNGGGHNKNGGENPPPPPPPAPHPQGPKGGFGENFGTGNGFRYRNIRCDVNGYRFYVRVRSECTQLRVAYGSYGYGNGGGYIVGGKNGGGYMTGGGYVQQGGGYYVTKKRKGRRVRVLVQAPVYAPAPVYRAQAYRAPVYQGGGYGFDGGYAYGGDFGYGAGIAVSGGYNAYGGQHVIRYVPTSRAAAMQQQRRAARHAAANGYAYAGGGYGTGMYVGGGYNYSDGGYVVNKRGKKRMRRAHMQMQPGYTYGTGIVCQCGPVGGGY